jgi:hypothetical protein
LSASVCAPGSVLLQPERLQGVDGLDPDAALVRDVIDAAVRIGSDKANGGSIVDVFEAAVEAMAGHLLDAAGGGLTRAVQHLQDVVAPVGAFVQRLPDMVSESSTPEEVASTLLDLLSSLARTAQGLTLGRIRATTGTFLDVLQQDLGLTSAAGMEQVWAFVDDLIARMEAVPPEDDPSVRINRLNLIGVVRRIRRRMKGAFVFPEFDADRLASLLFDQLTTGGFAEGLEKIACAGTAASAGLSVATSLAHVVPFTGFGSHSIGAGETGGGSEAPPDEPGTEYQWYASWLLGGKDIEWYQFWKFKSHVWIDRRGTQVEVRRRDHRLFLGGDIDWTSVPTGPFPVDVAPGAEREPQKQPLKYTFKRVSPAGMEVWARHLGWITDGFEAQLHLWHPLGGVTIMKGGQVSVTDLLSAITGAGHTAFDIGMKMPFKFWLLYDRRLDDHWYGTPAAFLPTFLSTFPGTFQGFHTNADAGHSFLWWLLLVLSDVMSVYGTYALAAVPRDVILGFITMLNYDGPTEAPLGDDTRPDNRTEMDGLLSVVNLLMTMFLIKGVVPREDYAHPFSGPGGHAAAMWLGYMLLGGILTGAMAGFLGTALAQALAAIFGSPATDWPLLGKNVLKGMVGVVLPFWITLWSFKENDTDGGKWNPDSGGGFNGYPDPSDSPYHLPWTGGDTIMCFQGNQGFFSHHALNGMQVYAYDFMLDKGDAVRAMRGGTVVDYFDWVPDYKNEDTPAGTGSIPEQTQTDNWNCVVIRHDQDTAKKHDLGPMGAASTTYAVYGHGQFGSVRQVFKGRGVEAGDIIGTVVPQGEALMLANSTGDSFCDHVHVAVYTGPATPASAADKKKAVTQSSLGVRIPFVFKEVGSNAGLSPTAGVPGSRTWHESENATP